MKQLFSLFFFFVFMSGLALAQAGDSEETLLEQEKARNEEQSPSINFITPSTNLSIQVTNPLFIGVDNATLPTSAFIGTPPDSVSWIPAFGGAEVWGSAYDPVNDKVYFNAGTVLWEWPVGGAINSLGTITDSVGGALSLVGLAFYNGNLYGTRNIANEAIYIINTSTLVATVHIDYVDASYDFGGFAVDPNTGEFYGTSDTPPRGLYLINNDATATLIADYPSGQTDIDGLAVSDDGFAYLVIDEPGDIFVWDFVGGVYDTPFANPWTSSELFSGGAWIFETGGMGLMLIEDFNTVGTDSIEARLIALGKTYTRVTNTVAMGMTTSDWLMYDAILWVGVPSVGEEQDSCIAYCNGGGNLGVMDNDVGYGTGSTLFYQDYLMSLYQTDTGSDGIITGLDMMDGIIADISADPYPDDILPNTGPYGTGIPIFLAPTTTTYAGMRGDGGTFRTLYLCWDPQYGGTFPQNLSILSRTIDWLVDAVIPVEMTSFTASVTETDVTLSWVTASETNNQGFEVERNDGDGFRKIGYVPGFGTTTETRSYSYTDGGLSEGTYSYRLKQIDFNGTHEYSEVVEVEIIVPHVYSLVQNYPNPFNPSTNIIFSLAVDSKVNLKVFDVLGQEVATLINRDLTAGVHNYDFNATGINSGVYFYRIEATGINGAEFVEVKKMILAK